MHKFSGNVLTFYAILLIAAFFWSFWYAVDLLNLCQFILEYCLDSRNVPA